MQRLFNDNRPLTYEDQYRAYVSLRQSKNMDRLAHFVHSDLTPLTAQEFQQMYYHQYESRPLNLHYGMSALNSFSALGSHDNFYV
jgi:hypothetical protein